MSGEMLERSIRYAWSGIERRAEEGLPVAFESIIESNIDGIYCDGKGW
jgi:hypothetical protein